MSLRFGNILPNIYMITKSLYFYTVDGAETRVPSLFGNSYKDCVVIEGNSGSSKPCQFPFTYKNETFNGCTSTDRYRYGKPWCSTKTDNNNIHIDGFSGDCPKKHCPLASISEKPGPQQTPNLGKLHYF